MRTTLPLFFIFFLASAFASAGCQNTDPSIKASKAVSFYLEDTFQPVSLSVYVEKDAAGPCIIAHDEGASYPQLLSVSPASLTYNSSSPYGILYFTLNATKPHGTANGTTVTSRFFDKSTGQKLFNVTLVYNILEKKAPAVNVVNPSCDPSTGVCGQPQTYIPKPDAGILEQNWPEIAVFLAIFALFVLVVFFFFTAIGGK